MHVVQITEKNKVMTSSGIVVINGTSIEALFWIRECGSRKK